ncbi:MAG: hypothetical protein HOL28_06100 [Crocinitomicaceae bacterium]|mgnify:CR=1 FL=1|jgi:tyrosine-protein kinase Etk/Wzc|nr:hypothetical protein [Crocinitomicaceae bacterium]MBT5403001.1 hypothetical protein [Crocinitomicaceae bacterium]
MSIFSEEQEEAKSILKFLFEHGVKIIIVFIIGSVVAICLTFFIPEKFRSSGIIYPPNSFTRDQLISNPQFGHETETEHLMQLLESSTLRDQIIKKFDLYKYYELDSMSTGWKQELNLRVIGDINFIRSKYLSVVISAELSNPEMTANIVNYIIDEVNVYKKNVFNENRASEIDFYKNRLERSEEKRDSVVSLIYALKDTTYAENLIENFKLRLNKDNFIENDYIDSRAMEVLIKKYNLLDAQTLSFQQDYNKAKDELRKPLLKNYVVDRAVPTYKKISPSFIINALVGGVLFMLTFLLFVILKTKYKLFKSAA